jgi:predicted metal-binding membrane protein
MLLAASAALTIACCTSMSAMAGMTMPGGWALSMTWMRMPGQSWPGVAALFLGMWTAMMVAMMLPPALPMLWRYRRILRGRGEEHLLVLAALGYFAVWTLIGVGAFPIGVGFAELAMRMPAVARAMPLAAGAVIVTIGMLQFSAWKARRLECCRNAPACASSLLQGPRSAWQTGLHLGFDCCLCCGSLMMIVLVIDVMDLATMAGVTAAISIERLVPFARRAAQMVGLLVVTLGVVLTADALQVY